MLGLLSRFWEWLTSLAGAILGLFAAPEEGRLRPWLRWTLHFALVGGVLVLLGFANYYFDVEVILQSPWPLLRKIWLPMVALLLYLLAWSGWWLWQLLRPEAAASVYPDIDSAWDEARVLLEQAGIDLTDLPLFLLLGEPRGGVEHLFGASQIPLVVRHAPRKADSPLRVYASRQAVYVTCVGASLLGRQVSYQAEAIHAGTTDTVPEQIHDEPLVTAAGRSRLTGKRDSLVLGSRRIEKDSSQAKKTASPNTGLMSSQPGREAIPLLKGTAEMELYSDRLAYLCQRIRQTRHPYCPVNGILVLVPWESLVADQPAQHTGRLCFRDLVTVQEVVQVQCPVFALVCDMEENEGFREIVIRLPEAQRRFRLGVGFPLAPDLETAQMGEMVESGVRWVCETQFPTLIYNLLELDPQQLDTSVELQGNVRLYQLLYEMRERRERLTRFLSRSILRPTLPLGGCFFAGSAPSDQAEPAFVAGVFPLLVQSQNAVAWTPLPLAEDTAYRRWTFFGYVSIALVLVGLIVVAYVL